MTAPLNITARIGAVGDPDRFDPRPLPFPAIRWAMARVVYGVFVFGFGAVLWVAL